MLLTTARPRPTVHARGIPRRAARPAPACPARRAVRDVRAHAGDDDEDIIPLLAPRRNEFSSKELEALAHPHTLGGKTVGEELAIIREQYLASEAAAAKGEARLHTASKGGNWDGDVYVGSPWNVMTVLGLIGAAVPLAGIVFAVATKGVLWGLVDYYGH